MRYIFMLVLLPSFCCSLFAQKNDPEFPKEFIMHMKLHNGMVTNFHGLAPDQYVGGLQLIPQYTFVPGKLRGGIIVDGFYTGKKFQAAFGPTISFKLKSINVGPVGTGGNIHLSADYLFGTQNQRLIGGGIHADVLNWVVIGLTAHRDYYHNTWWFQNAVGFRISKLKREDEPFNKKHH